MPKSKRLHSVTKGTTMVLDLQHVVRVVRGGARVVEVQRESSNAIIRVAKERLTPRYREAKPDEVFPGAELFYRLSSKRLAKVKVLFFSSGVVVEFPLRHEQVPVQAHELLVDDVAALRNAEQPA